MEIPSDFNPNIPKATDKLSVSQGQILNDFGALQAFVDINHADFADPNAGKHTFIEMPVQSPVPTTSGNEVGLYCQTSTITAQPEMVFARQAGSSAPAAVRITEFTSARWQTPGYAILPSGIMMKWNNNVSLGFTNTVTVNTNAIAGTPNFTQLLTVLICPVDSASTYNNVIGISNITSPNFTAYTPSVSVPGTVAFNYLAIGY